MQLIRTILFAIYSVLFTSIPMLNQQSSGNNHISSKKENSCCTNMIVRDVGDINDTCVHHDSDTSTIADYDCKDDCNNSCNGNKCHTVNSISIVARLTEKSELHSFRFLIDTKLRINSDHKFILNNSLIHSIWNPPKV